MDLHGLTVREALDLIESVLRACAATKAQRQHSRGGRVIVLFIVGKGLHSQDGRSRLGPAVTAKLSRCGVAYVSREGVVEATL